MDEARRAGRPWPRGARGPCRRRSGACRRRSAGRGGSGSTVPCCASAPPFFSLLDRRAARVALGVLERRRGRTRPSALRERVDHAESRRRGGRPRPVDCVARTCRPRAACRATSSSAGFLYLRVESTGMPRPSSSRSRRLRVGVERHLDALGVAVDHLVDRVVDNLPEQVVEARACRCRRCTSPGACGRARGPRGPRCRRRCSCGRRVGSVGSAGGRTLGARDGGRPSGHLQRGTTSGAGTMRVKRSRLTTACPCCARATEHLGRRGSSLGLPFSVSTGSLARSRASADADAHQRSPSSTFITMTPLPAPASAGISADRYAEHVRRRSARADHASSSPDRHHGHTSSPSFGLAKRRPARVEGSRCARSEKRKPKPARVTASANGGSGSSRPRRAAGLRARGDRTRGRRPSARRRRA